MNFFSKFTKIVGGYSDVKEDNLQLVSLSSLGLSCKCASIAYDEAQSNLAIGTLEGVVLFGKEFEIPLEYPSDTKPGPVTRLYFKQGDRQLVGVIGSQAVVWNLAQPSLSFSFDFGDDILDVAVHPESQWIFIGLVSGQIKLLDFTNRRLSDYEFKTEINTKLKSLKVCPTDCNLVFIGHEKEALIWDCKQGKPLLKYEYEQSSLINAIWSFDGSFLTTFHEDATVQIWGTKKKKSLIGKSKPKPEYQFQEFQVIHSATWTVYDDKSYLFLCSGESQFKLTRIQLDFDKLKNSTAESAIILHPLFSLEMVGSNRPLLFGLSVNSIQCYDLELNPIDLFPASVRLYNDEVVKSWAIGEDGYDIVMSQDKNEWYLKGGTVIRSNTARNYHILITARGNAIELWHLGIPYPKFIMNIPSTLDLSKYTIKPYLDHKCIVASNETAIIGFEQTVIQDMDNLMAQIDATMNIVQNDSNDIKEMIGELTSNHQTQNNGMDEEEDVHSFKDSVPTEPPNAMNATSSQIQFPPYLSYLRGNNDYFKDPHWHTSFEIQSTAPIVTFAISHPLSMVALATSENICVVNYQNGRCILNFHLDSLPGNSVKIVSNMRFSYSVYQNHQPCLYLYTPNSIFTFIIEQAGVSYKLVPDLELNFPDDIGHVHSIDFCDTSGNAIKSNKRPQSVYMAVFGSLRTIVLQSTNQEDYTVIANRPVENETIVKGRLAFNNGVYLTVVTLLAIKVYDISLNLIYQTKNGSIPRLSIADLERIHISSNGLLGMKIGNQFKLFQMFPDTIVPKADTRVYDLYVAQKFNDSKGRKLFSRNTEADKTFAPAIPVSEFAELGNKLNERGEKLAEIQEKSSRLADSSKTFVDTIREYNRKQEEKKWWQI